MGFFGTFDMIFLISLANYPDKFSLVLFYFQVKTHLPWAIQAFERSVVKFQNDKQRRIFAFDAPDTAPLATFK